MIQRPASLLPRTTQEWLSDRRGLIRWWRSGRTSVPPPPVVKQRTIRNYKKSFNLRTLVETGTYLGRTVEVFLQDFDKIYSIELGEKLWRAASDKFKGWPHVEILHGNSGELIPALLESVSEPCLFWLDAHYSQGRTVRGQKETPIREELRTILSHPVEGHVLLIDDARDFTGTNDYPTVDEIRQLVARYKATWQVTVRYDIVRIHDMEAPRLSGMNR